MWACTPPCMSQLYGQAWRILIARPFYRSPSDERATGFPGALSAPPPLGHRSRHLAFAGHHRWSGRGRLRGREVRCCTASLPRAACRDQCPAKSVQSEPVRFGRTRTLAMSTPAAASTAANAPTALLRSSRMAKPRPRIRSGSNSCNQVS